MNTRRNGTRHNDDSLSVVETPRSQMLGESLNACFASAMLQRCRYVEGGFADHAAGLAIAFTNLQVPSSYCVVTAAPDSRDSFAAHIERAVTHGNAAAAPWDLVVLDDWVRDDAYEQTLMAAGLRRVGTIVGMRAPELAPRRRAAPVLEFSPVASADGLKPFAAINNGAYGYAAVAGTHLYEHYLRAPGSHAVVGWLDGVPVACAAAFPTELGTYLGGVATVEQYRGRGYGEAASRAAISLATAHGSPVPAILFASRKRAAFYEPLGFVAGATLRVYRRDASDSPR